MIFVACNGAVSAGPNGEILCPSGWVQYTEASVLSVQNPPLSPEDFQELWGYGAGLILIGFGIKKLRQLFEINPGRGA